MDQRVRMYKRVMVATIAAAISLLQVPGTASPAAGSPAVPTLSVELSPDPARLNDGAVKVVAWTVCSPGLTAFELDLSVNQGSSFGSQSQLFRDVVPCDGVRHRTSMTVAPDIGSFGPGPATLSAYLAANENGGGDIEATDEVTVPLRQVWQPAVVQISERPIRITPAGSVRVVFWYRCLPKYQPYELDVGASQDSVNGSSQAIAPPPVVTCDGTRHKMVQRIVPSSGSFHRGPAQIAVFLGLYDTVEDHDADVNQETTVRLFRRLS